MEKLHFTVEEEIPVTHEADVLVVGGGPGGLGAAVMAARMGAKVILAERYDFLGGMSTMGEVTPFMPNYFRKGESDIRMQMDRPVLTEWRARMIPYLTEEQQEHIAKNDSEGNYPSGNIINPAVSGLVMEEMLLDEGVTILYHHDLVKAITEDGRITAAVFHAKSGFSAIRAKCFVDSTGDGDLSVLAGAPFEFGNKDGFCQPMTTCFKLENVDVSRLPSRAEINALYDQAKAEGRIHCLRENVLFFGFFRDDVIHFNTTRIIQKSGVSGTELSEAEIEGHRQIREMFSWFRSSVPGFEKAMLRSVAPHVGIRESRRILGLQYLTDEAFLKRSWFPDGVVRCNYTIDIHNPSGSGTTIVKMTDQEFYEIPFGCLVPKNVRNLAVGSRCISVSHELHSSCRVMPPVVSIGQAAGTAAAMAAKSGTDLCTLDGTAVRNQLAAMGAFL